MTDAQHSDFGQVFERLCVAAVAAMTLLATGLFFWTGDPSSMLLAAGAPIFILMIIRFPALIAIAFFALSSFRLTEGFQTLHGLSIPLVLGVMTLGAIGYHSIARVNIVTTVPRQVQLMLVFFVVMSISVLFAKLPDRASDLWSDGFIKAFIAGVALFVLVQSRTDLICLFWATLLSGAALAPIVLYHKWAGIGLVEGTRAVIAPGMDSILADPNFSAMVLLIPFSLAMALFESPSRRWQGIVGCAIAALTLLGVIATQSRGALLATMIVFTVFVGRRLKSRVLLAMLAVLVALMLASAMGIGSRSSGGSASMAEGGLDASASQRLVAWQAAISMAIKHPFTGVGMNSFRQLFYYYTPTWIGRSMDVHSTWLLVLGEGGVIAFGAYMSAIWLTLRAFAQSMRALRPPALSGPIADPILYATTFGFFLATVSFITTGSFISSPYSSIPISLVAISAVITRCLATKATVSDRSVDHLGLRDIATQRRPSSFSIGPLASTP
jgi:putative inorganic carbon (hco3(-)) transporter